MNLRRILWGAIGFEPPPPEPVEWGMPIYGCEQYEPYKYRAIPGFCPAPLKFPEIDPSLLPTKEQS